jgi:hypothetical protein
MAVSEESRYALMRRLEEVLGRDEAVTLIEHLPPVGWADVATKRDLEHLELRLTSRMDVLESRFDAKLEAALSQLSQRLMVTMISTIIAAAAVLVAAIKV